ncbi:MAG: glucuronate isomerase [Eubacteriales bacterium]|nr:glucuronate isomerase [Eubacteriales bacterium]
MREFMDGDFLLETETARRLFHGYAEAMPLIDYHCHISPQEIWEDRRFENLAQIWLGGRNEDGSYFGDHYKWRLMRSNGVPEETVTGGADAYEKFLAFAGAMEMAPGNPMVHWCNLELRRYFGVTKPLTTETAQEIWEHCNDLLQNDPDMSVRGLIRKSNVAFVGTTDDPTDSLEWHEKIAADPSVSFRVCPSFRPDKAVNIHRDGFAAYMAKLAGSVGRESLESLQDVLDALDERIAFFKEHGCRASDHGLDYVMFRPCTQEEADAVYRKAMAGEPLSTEEAERYQTAVLLHLARTYHRHGIVMEIHYSCLRNANARMFALEGPDTGFDMIAQNNCGGNLAAFLSALDQTGELPQTILFSLDDKDFNMIGTLIGSFQTDEMPGKIQMGAAWWFLDTKDGMEKQMRSLGNLGLLGTFVGMLTDSRSFLSYTRHEYFRRIFCNLLGGWVENGEFPNDERILKQIVEGVCCRNAERYFHL